MVDPKEIRANMALSSLNLDKDPPPHDDDTDTVLANIANYADLTLWHRRLGHVDRQKIRIMFNKKVAEGLSIKGAGRGCDADCLCPTCAATRATRQPVHKTPRFDPKLHGIPFRNVQVDLKGPLVVSTALDLTAVPGASPEV